MERDECRRLRLPKPQCLGRAPGRSLFARVRYLKRAMGEALKEGFVSDSTRAKLRLAAALRPDLFGEWANL
jgi:hypothetical protein